MKPIHFHLYDMSGPHIFFKPKANDKAKAFTIHCNNSENCEVFKRGQCILKPTFGYTACPYGKYNEYSGPTRRARGFREWCSNLRKQYEGVPYIQEPPKKLATVGDYIYVPYSHATMNENVPFLSKSHFMSNGTCLIKKEDWNVDTIFKILKFSPQALFGGTIHTYQTEEMPLFLRHLEEVMPEMYAALLDKHPHLIPFYKLEKKEYKGRTALLKTIKPCTFHTKGSRSGEYSVAWIWDGVVAKTSSIHAYSSTWGELNNGAVETTYTPSDKTTIVITDNAQVDKNTIFTD